MAKPSLLAKIKTLDLGYNPRKWIDGLSPSQSKELFELRDAWKSGALKDASGRIPSILCLWKLVLNEFGAPKSRSAFVEWLQK